MGGADIVDRGLLHQPHVAQRKFVVDHLHRAGVGGVAGDAAQFDGLSVQLQYVAVDGHFAESESVAEGLQRASLLLQRRAQGVEVGRLGRPEARILK